jgi:hypothetical protein
MSESRYDVIINEVNLVLDMSQSRLLDPVIPAILPVARCPAAGTSDRRGGPDAYGGAEGGSTVAWLP